MSNSPRIVVGYDGSADAEAALAWGVETALAQDNVVEVVIVTTPGEAAHRRVEDAPPEEAPRISALKRLAELGAADSSVVARRGPVVPELLEASEGAAMLVVGSAGHGLATGTLTGSVSQHLARHAGCPVVVVRPQRSPHARRIMVGVDGSVESERALRFACERSRRTGENVVGVHGYHSPTTRMLALDPAATGEVARTITAAERVAAELCAEVAKDYPGIEIEPEAIAVRPGPLLVSVSATASLVVVGSRGRDAFAGLLLGSVSHHVLHHAACPVAIVR